MFKQAEDYYYQHIGNEFGICVSPHEGGEGGWSWVIWDGDDEMDSGWNTKLEEAFEDSELAMTEYMNDAAYELEAAVLDD